MPINLIHFEQCQFSDAYRDKHGFTLVISNFLWIDRHAFGFINSYPYAMRQVLINIHSSVCKCLNVIKK